MSGGTYIGAREASAVVGRWSSVMGSDVTIYRPPQAPQPQQPYPHHHHHHHHGYGYGGGGGGYGYGQPAQQLPFREPTRAEYEASPRAQVVPWHVRDHRRRSWEAQFPGVPFVGAEALAIAHEEACYGNPVAAAAAQFGIPPRAALVPQPDPTMANRQVLPMNTGGQNVGVGLTAIITSRPQRVAFRPERVFVSATGTSTQGAAAWLVNDITIGNRSQYVQQGALPGDMFATGAIDSFITFETAQTAMDVTMSVTFNDATVSDGQPFYGSLIGTAAM